MKVVLLGGSNSIVKNGLRVGLENKDIIFHNYALGLSSSLQNLYELIRQKDTIKNADYIISESNINDYLSLNDLNIIIRNIDYFYEELYKANKTTIVLILPIPVYNNKSKTINEIHRRNCAYYGFNLIDVDFYYQKNNLYDFDQNYKFHPMPLAIQELGKNIIKNLHLFKKNKKDIFLSKRTFSIYTPSNLITYQHKNSFFCELTSRIDNKAKLQFPKKYHGYQILGIHTWNKNNLNIPAYSSLIIESSQHKIIKNFGLINTFQDIESKEAIITDKTLVYINTQDTSQSEKSTGIYINEKTKKLNYLDLIGILLIKDDEFKISYHNNLTLNAYNFLIPNIQFYKNLILEYQELTKLDTLAFIQSKNYNLMRFLEHKNLKTEYENFISQNNKLYGANLRIKERLSYKLGEVVMKNSKSFGGYLKMPFILRKTKKEHLKRKINEKTLPPLKAYADYKQAQIAKTHLPYLLGNELLRASKTPYKLGYLSLPFKLKKIAKNYKKKL